MNKKNKQSVSCDYRVTDLNHQHEDLQLHPNKVYTLVIDYPFDKVGHFDIKTGKKGLTVSGLLPHIYRAYVAQYEAAKKDPKNGYWHIIEDLVVEGIEVDHKNKLITLEMGS